MGRRLLSAPHFALSQTKAVASEPNEARAWLSSQAGTAADEPLAGDFLVRAGDSEVFEGMKLDLHLNFSGPRRTAAMVLALLGGGVIPR